MLRRKPLKRSALKRTSRLKPFSAKRAKALAEYAKLRERFLFDHPWCGVWLHNHGFHWNDTPTGWWAKNAPRSVDIHHRFCGANRKRTFLDTTTWVAVSRAGHRYIHDNPAWARKVGLLA